MVDGASFFFSVLTPDATRPNAVINLAYVGAVVLATGLVILGIGLIRARMPPCRAVNSLTLGGE